jgi:DNA-binding MarR family transcriptional regulator
MSDEINFFDLTALLKVTPETTMEKFGGILNSSYFDGANIAATLSQKGLINFNTSLPGQSIITLTSRGSQLIEEANSKVNSEFDHLDFAVLVQIANGKKTPFDIGSAVNVRSKDLAMHLYKLAQQDYVSYEFRSGSMTVMLTEKGFSQVKTGMPKINIGMNQQNAQSQTQSQDAVPTNNQSAQEQTPTQTSINWQSSKSNTDAVQSSNITKDPNAAPVDNKAIEDKIKNSKRLNKKSVLVGLVVALILIFVLLIAFFVGMGKI